MHRLLTIAALVLSFGVSSAEAAKRVALVIGNDSYKSLPDLNNARTDARGMAAKLKELGWSVILKQDASRRDISRSLADFEGRLKDAEVGLVFYAGHGIQKDGANYLVASDARIEVEEDLRLEGVDAGEFLKTMERAGAPLNIVILDACRDNPLPKRSRSGARGLSIPVIPKGIKGTAILYSAAPGQVAQDGPRGGHGVFTGELLKVLDRPGLKLEEVFKQTATKVAAATNGSQDPWINSSVKGDFFFREGKATPSAAAPAADKETVFWQSIEDSRQAADFKDYLARFPKGTFSGIAKRRIAELEKKLAALSPPSFTVEAMDETLVALRSANVRERPTASSAKVATLKPGSAVEVTGKTQFEGKDWYRVAFKGRTAFVFVTLLGPKPTVMKPPPVAELRQRYPNPSGDAGEADGVARGPSSEQPRPQYYYLLLSRPEAGNYGNIQNFMRKRNRVIARFAKRKVTLISNFSNRCNLSITFPKTARKFRTPYQPKTKCFLVQSDYNLEPRKQISGCADIQIVGRDYLCVRDTKTSVFSVYPGWKRKTTIFTEYPGWKSWSLEPGRRLRGNYFIPEWPFTSNPWLDATKESNHLCSLNPFYIATYVTYSRDKITRGKKLIRHSRQNGEFELPNLKKVGWPLRASLPSKISVEFSRSSPGNSFPKQKTVSWMLKKNEPLPKDLRSAMGPMILNLERAC